MKHLYFVRHGQSEMNKAGLRAGQVETPLTEEGREQAERAGLKAIGLHIDHIISSPYSRAHDTAKIIAAAIGYPAGKIELNSLLVERNFGALEGVPWEPDLNMDGIADAESTDTLYERTLLVYEYLLTLDADNILVVGHSSSGRMLRHIADPGTPFHGSPSFPNAEIVRLA